MLSNIKKIIYIVFMVMLGSGINPNSCLADVESSQIYPETVWLSLDLPKETQDKIDTILVESYTQRKNIWSKQDRSVTYGFNELSSYDDFNKINEIRTKSAEKIMELLSLEEKRIVKNKLEKYSQLAEDTLLMVLGLDLSMAQQKSIVNSLLEDQQRIACIVSDKTFSWEERRRELKNCNVLELFSPVLNREQLTILTEWDKSLTNGKRNQLMVKK